MQSHVVLGEQFEKLEQIQAWNDASKENLGRIEASHEDAADLAGRTGDALRDALEYFRAVDEALGKLGKSEGSLERKEIAQSALVEDYR